MFSKSHSLLLAACGGGALFVLSCGSFANAQVVYNDTFARTGALLGSSPSPVDSGGAYWQGSAGTMDNTTAQTNGSELTLSSASGYAVASAFLPFTPPTSGTVTLSANIEVAGTSGEWGTIGFVNDSQVGNGMVNAGPAIVVVNSSSVLLEPNDTVGVSPIYSGVPNFNSSTFYHFSIDYNLSTQTVQWYLGSGASATLLGSYDYASNPGSTPAISQVEVGSQGSSGNEVINFQNFELTSTTPVPEPAALALFGVGGGLGLLLLKRRHRLGVG